MICTAYLQWSSLARCSYVYLIPAGLLWKPTIIVVVGATIANAAIFGVPCPATAQSPQGVVALARPQFIECCVFLFIGRGGDHDITSLTFPTASIRERLVFIDKSGKCGVGDPPRSVCCGSVNYFQRSTSVRKICLLNIGPGKSNAIKILPGVQL